MFEVVGQDIISGNMGFIGTDSDRLYRMGQQRKRKISPSLEILPFWTMQRENRSRIYTSTAGASR
mgnify:CR=1 FL=1